MAKSTSRQRSNGKRKHSSTVRQKPRSRRVIKGKYNGKPVYDATTSLVIKIGRADIVKSKMGDPDHCAAAIALVRQEPIMAAHVYRSRVFIEFRDKVIRYITPGRLRQETISFDRGTPEKFLEGDYTLIPPSDSLRLGQDHRKWGKAKSKKILVEQQPVQGARPSSSGHWHYLRET